MDVLSIRSPLQSVTNKELAHKWFEVLWNQKNPGVISELLHPTCHGMSEGGEVHGPDEFKQLIFDPMFVAFPDLQICIDGIVGEEDEVVVRWTVTATHQGNLLHLSASGRRVSFSGMTWLKFVEGKIVKGVDRYNLHGLFTYLISGTECVSVRHV